MPAQSAATPSKTAPKTQPFYGLSPVFKVVEDTSLTGSVTISGTAESGYVLTADTSAIMDTDGLTNVDYDFQWIRVDSDGSSNPTNIGTDFHTYSLVNADVGSKIKVRVDFTDDAGQRPHAHQRRLPVKRDGDLR